MRVFKVGDLVEYENSDLKGIVVGFYEEDRCRVLSRNGHEWLLKKETLNLIKREKKIARKR